MNAELTRNFPVGKGRIGFKVSNYFPVPVGKLWDAITLGRQMERFFIEQGRGRFHPGPDARLLHLEAMRPLRGVADGLSRREEAGIPLG